MQPLSQADVAGIRRGVVRMSARLRAQRPREALSGNKIAVLGHLHRRGTSSPGEIAAATHQQPQSLTRVFAELQLSGLVARQPDPSDGRGYLLSLTAEGRSALQADMRQRDRWLARALADLPADDLRTLVAAAAILEQLAEHEDEQTADARRRTA